MREQAAGEFSKPALGGWFGAAARRLRGDSARTGAIALADQTLVSASNFGSGLLIARALPPASYGLYALLFVALLGLSGVQIALLTGPLTVFAPREQEHGRSPYLSSLWVLQLALAAVAGGAIALVLAMWPGLIVTRPLLTLAAVALVAQSYLCQEFVRRVLFCYGYPTTALVTDLISYGLQLAVLAALSAAGRLTLDGAFWTISLTSLLATLVGVLRLVPRLGALTRAVLADTCRRHWEFGRWLLWGTLANWSATQAYAFVIAALLSPAAAGLLVAGRQLLGFTHIFLLGLENFVPATMTRRLLSHGPAGLAAWTQRFRLLSAALVTLVCAPLALGAEPLVRWLFGAEYVGAALVVQVSAIGYIVIACNRPTMFALRALGSPRWTFRANLAAAATTLLAAVPLVALGGVAGAASGIVLANLVTLIVASAGYRRELRAVGALAERGEPNG